MHYLLEVSQLVKSMFKKRGTQESLNIQRSLGPFQRMTTTGAFTKEATLKVGILEFIRDISGRRTF